tara:strand:- start:123 stop:959 length:837 start_codon:yes stop_codon:yes gene_type:complete
MKNKKLGMGLSSLLGAKPSVEKNLASEKNLFFTPIEHISRDPGQPRKEFDQEKIKELASSIKQHGLIQPIILAKNAENDYKIVAGERRWRAAQIANLKAIPSIILPADLDNNEVSLIENIQRENLKITEEANAYKNLIEKKKYTHDQLASIVGKSRSHITNILRILSLNRFFMDLLDKEIISLGHAKILIGRDPSMFDEKTLKRFSNKKISVRELEKIINNKKQVKKSDINITTEEKNLSSLIGFKSQIKYDSKGKGYIKIFYDNLEQYDFLVKKIKS